MFENVKYSMRGNAVVIHGWSAEDFCLDLPSLEQSIKNVKSNRLAYATAEAWQRDLSIREGALEYLKSQLSILEVKEWGAKNIGQDAG